MATPKFSYRLPSRALQNLAKKIEEIPQAITKRDAEEAAKVIEAEMKALIAKGDSPIAGRGKFEPYRGQYRSRIAKYGYISVRGTKYRKSLRPINLKLTGEFLNTLQGRASKSAKFGFEAQVGFFGPGSGKSRKKEQGHREGANGQAERPIIPRDGEKFHRRIVEKYLKVFRLAVQRHTRKKIT